MNEVVPQHLRGGLVDIHAVMLIFGYTVQGWVGFGFYFWKTGGSNTWRPPIALQCAWPLFLLIGLYWIPESPRWLVMNDRIEEAHVILQKLHSDPSDPSDTYARKEFYQIQKQFMIDRTLGSSWIHLFKKPSYRKSAFLALGTTAIIQCSGVLVINNYGPTLYKNLGFSPVKQLLYPAAWLTTALGFNIMAIFVVDIFPRQKYMGFGVLGCMATLIVEAALVANYVPSTNGPALQAAVAMFFVLQLFYSFCLNGTDSSNHKKKETILTNTTGTQFSYLGELFPTHLRTKGVCLDVAMISLMNIVWLQSAPTAFLQIGWKFYLPFIIPGTIGAIVMIMYFPDTKGLPLEEVAALFGDLDEIAVYQREIELKDGGVDGDHHIGGVLGEKMGTSDLEQDGRETCV